MGMHYAADPDRRDVAFWVEEAGQGKVDLASATWWATKYEWDAMRARFWFDLESRFMKGAVARLAHQRLREINRLEILSKKLFDWLMPNSDGSFRVQPRSYEGVALALKAIDEHLTAKRSELVGQLGDRPALPVGHIPSFSAVQVAALAKAALQLRREQLDAEQRLVPVGHGEPESLPAEAGGDGAVEVTAEDPGSAVGDTA